MEGIEMLRSYEAIYDHGKMKWLGDQPADIEARVIVTILSDKVSIPTTTHEPRSTKWNKPWKLYA
jgi:hypothetical protein